jgi:hypothetical protein
MFNSRGLLSFFLVALSFFIGLISASPVPPKGHAAVPANGHAAQCPANLKPRSNKIFLGYNGFNGTPRSPQASAGGELGAVFYIADVSAILSPVVSALYQSYFLFGPSIWQRPSPMAQIPARITCALSMRTLMLGATSQKYGSLLRPVVTP